MSTLSCPLYCDGNRLAAFRGCGTKTGEQISRAVPFETAVPERLQTTSERHLRVDLQNATVERYSEEGAVRVSVRPNGRENAPKDRARDAINRKVKVLVVENIERGCPDGKSETFTDLEVL